MTQRIYLIGVTWVIACLAEPARAGASWVCGPISNLTSTTDGLIVRIGEPPIVPDNCAGPQNGGYWMLIPNAASTMVSVTLSRWLVGKKNFCIYTTPTTNTYCAVSQAHPQE